MHKAHVNCKNQRKNAEKPNRKEKQNISSSTENVLLSQIAKKKKNKCQITKHNIFCFISSLHLAVLYDRMTNFCCRHCGVKSKKENMLLISGGTLFTQSIFVN